MATPQLSPGLLVREVDLTVGRADNVQDTIGAIAGPFQFGPVDEVVQINTEQQLTDTFGPPLSTNRQYEYWLAGASYLSYGGVLKVARTDDTDLNNANAAAGYASTDSIKIKNYDDYLENYDNDSQAWLFAGKTPGRYINSLKVCAIDDFADQRIGINTTSLSAAGAVVGNGVTVALTNAVLPGTGSTSNFNGYLQGIVAGVSTDSTNGTSTVDVKITNRVAAGGTITPVTYAKLDGNRSLSVSDSIHFVNASGINTGVANGVAGATWSVATQVDWYDQQTLGLKNSNVYWKAIAPKPVSSQYTLDRQGKNDTLHIVVVDDEGTVTGIQGNILEKHLNLSKASDATDNLISPDKSYYKDYLAKFSEYVYAGKNPSSGWDSYWGFGPVASGFSTDFTQVTRAGGLWGQEAQGVNFTSIGPISLTLAGGEDYGSGGGMTATLGNLITSYNLFSNKDDEEVDFLLMGPGASTEAETQAKANKLIALCESRKDCMTTISPFRGNVVNLTNSTTQTNNVLGFYSPIASSSYAVFDTGYKYMYDRFNNVFRWIPTNGDVAGLMARTNVEAYPWFSPAGQQRGVLNNAIKLAYNPDKDERDLLYPERINAVINSPGQGVLLFGDKTGLGYASAFDRINVRRLFLTIEQALENAAKAQLFELNDDITRANFVNIVEPYLRDIEAKRGLYGYLVICDETNNTPDIIDNNEFRADIFLKPAKSINYVTLTFVATRTGVSFEEVAGRV